MELTQEIKKYILDQGADLVGVASAKGFSCAPEGHRPSDYLPAAKSVISYGCSLNFGAIAALPKSRNEYFLEFEQANSMLNNCGYKTAKFLERKGFSSIAFPATASIGDGKRLKGDISNKHAAVASGLGLFGLNNLVLTPQFGSRIRFGTIVTATELTPDKPQDDSLCDRCGKCVNACPAGALDNWKESFNPQEGWRMAKERCYHYIFVKLAGKRCGMCIASCPKSLGEKLS